MKPTGSNLLGIYLNDHLAGATAGTELARRMARSHRGGEGSAREDSGALDRLAAEIAQDRSALLTIMAALGITVRAYKVGAAWIGEKAGRLKFNGRLLARSPLSDLEELESCGWAWRARRPAGARCGPGRTPTRGSAPVGLTSSSPGPAARSRSWRNSGSAPQAAS
jgi:hypothetical protein